MKLSEKEKIEIDYWQDSSFESPKNFTKANFLNKIQECRNFNYKITKNIEVIRHKKSVLEVGAGQGWASCFLKKYFLKNAKFTVTDISPHAIASIVNWEKTFDIKIEKSYASKSYEIAEDNKQFDLIFCYAAAHHFVLYEKTLIELKRLLTDDGHIIFIYEPTSSKLFYPMYYYYVNKVDHSTPEDVLVPSKIRKICKRINLNYINHYDSNQVLIRNLPTGIYFSILGKLKFLQKYLPSSSDLVFFK
jgi:ubiquinone/menaquinone biosynthesis C-methylase UbiE